jgi:hypothetical protein
MPEVLYSRAVLSGEAVRPVLSALYMFCKNGNCHEILRNIQNYTHLCKRIDQEAKSVKFFQILL